MTPPLAMTPSPGRPQQVQEAAAVQHALVLRLGRDDVSPLGPATPLKAMLFDSAALR
jgi:hypothetical protein